MNSFINSIDAEPLRQLKVLMMSSIYSLYIDINLCSSTFSKLVDVLLKRELQLKELDVSCMIDY